MTFTMVLRELDGEPVEVTVKGEMHGPCPGATDGRHGPKIEPDDPGGFEIDEVLDAAGNEVEITRGERREIEREAYEHIPQPDYGE